MSAVGLSVPAGALTRRKISRALEAGAVNADITAHYYEGLYHEILNEPEEQQVLADLMTWIGTVVR